MVSGEKLTVGFLEGKLKENTSMAATEEKRKETFYLNISVSDPKVS